MDAKELEAFLIKQYRDGYHDGVAETVAQILDESKVDGTHAYKGPMPEELREWLEKVKTTL